MVPHSVTSTSQFQSSLRDYLSNPPEEPEHTEAQFSFWIGTTFMVPPPASTSSTTSQSQSQLQAQQASQPAPHQHAHAPPGYQPAHYGGPAQYQHLGDTASTLAPAFSESIEPNNGAATKDEHRVSSTVYDALQPTPDPKEKMRKQRAIAKCCVDMIQRIDGYRYSFHNCWNSREDDSFRFSYYCNDSLLNKDRAANGKGAKLGKRATKPVYDCKGVLSIKFSAAKQTLDVIYKHVPIHKTYEERAPPPRKDSKRRKYLEENDPEALVRLASRSRQLSSEDPDTPRPKRKKSQPPPLPLPETPRQSNTSLESDLRAQSLRSLLELIQVDSPVQVAPTPPDPPPPPPPQRPASAPRPTLHVETDFSPNQQRRRPRTSCDACKTKKTKVRSELGSGVEKLKRAPRLRGAGYHGTYLRLGSSCASFNNRFIATY